MAIIRRSALVLAATAFLLGAVFTVTTALDRGPAAPAPSSLATSPPTHQVVRICASGERCTPQVPLNSPAMISPTGSVAFLAAGVAILAQLYRRRRSSPDVFVLPAPRLAIFRPPIAS